jgi:aminoglycoside phosphotransferase (APT) family kinase protein
MMDGRMDAPPPLAAAPGSPTATPAAEVNIDEALVRALLQAQHPDLAHLTITRVASGWDNVIYRLGDDLCVRLPRRRSAAELIEHEQQWLPELAPMLPLRVPVPVRVGRPGAGFPWAWSVCPWLAGEIAATRPPDDAMATAEVLGRFLAVLHRPAPAEAPVNPVRGIPLAERSPIFHEHLARLGTVIDVAAVRACWHELATARPWAEPKFWLHGDLHPANLLVVNASLSAAIDFGDLTAGDPATDLAVAWMLLPPAAHTVLRDARGRVDDDLWARARAWALSWGVACVAHSVDNPMLARLGRPTLDAALAGP